MTSVCSTATASLVRIYSDSSQATQSTSDDDSGCIRDEYVWVPKGVKPDMIHMYFASIPENRIPYANSVGEKWRKEQLIIQLPPQDLDVKDCGNISIQEQRELTTFAETRRRECGDQGMVQMLPLLPNSKLKCYHCHSSFRKGEIVIKTNRFDQNTLWHPRCFQCTECSELLVDLIYYKADSEIYCGRHHAERYKVRCGKCDELIFSNECTEAEGRAWHMKHFLCASCDCQLGGQRYIAKDEGMYCTPCYYSSYPHISCNTCQKEIVPDKPHITKSNFHWHTDERCFCCSVCEINLMGKNFNFQGNQLFCMREGCRRMERAMSQQSTSSGPSSFNSKANNRKLSSTSSDYPLNSSRNHNTSGSLEKDCSRSSIKSSPSLSMDQRMMSASSTNMGPNNDNISTTENVYETLYPCGSSNSSSRGSLIYPASSRYDNEKSYPKNALPPPPPHLPPYKQNVRFVDDSYHSWKSRRSDPVKWSRDVEPIRGATTRPCSSCSSSDSERDDEFLSEYLAASGDFTYSFKKSHLPINNYTSPPRPNQLIEPFTKLTFPSPKHHQPSKYIQTKKAKKKSSGKSCIVS
uniref:LIM zinc-binding domain-containing protein n=1 Tax=Rhabditophanes sp. KR3021 TaxID=114890 RepID=A0AC35TX85_9BILA